LKAIEPLDVVPARQRNIETDRSGTAAVLRIPASPSELHFELALWARSLESFCSIGRNALKGTAPDRSENRNYRNEFYITHLVLLRCAELIEELLRGSSNFENDTAAGVREFRATILPLISSSKAFTRLKTVSFSEWKGWSEIVAQRIASTEIYSGFDLEFETVGRSYLPERFLKFLESPELSAEDRGDLERFLPFLGGILRSLDIVRQMLEADLPLKSTLAIFAFIYEVVQEVTFLSNERLAHRDDETSEIFAMFDGAIYTITIESRKVYSHELGSLIDTRSATAVYAHVEAAYGLLNDNIRHLLTGFLRLAEPGVPAAEVFPQFNDLVERSIQLRKDLWSILSAVRSAESDLENGLRPLQEYVAEFLKSSIRFLFYKDQETFERFCNEILAASNGQDSGAIVHRFSAYVETLFNEVGMRAVLANHPFDPHA
jgi:hypothetical protein